MEKFTYSGSNKILLRIAHLLNRKAPLPIDGNGDPEWGTAGQVLTTDGAGNTSWGSGGGGGGDTVSYTPTLQSGTKTGEISINGISQDMYAPTPPTKTSDLTNDSGFITSADVPTKTSDLTNDSGFITNLVNDLANYYTKSQTYTQAEVDALISGIVTLNILVVQTLPTQDISTTTIYLVPKQDTGTSDIYDEYLYINNAWELIGTTQIDLSNYVTTTDLSTALADYVTFVGLATILADYAQISDLPTVNDGTLTIQQNGTTVGTFSANQSGNTTVNLTGGGGSGGHTIEDTSGADLPQEDNLQFVGVYTEDDSANDRTKVNIVRQMTKAAMEALSSAEKEGFIDTTDEDDDYIPISAEDVKYGNTDVESALDSINAQISGGSRTVTTLVNETANISASGNKTYATLTASALSAYDEIWIYAEYGNVANNGSASKAQIAAAASYGGGAGATINFMGYVLETSGTISISYAFGIKPLSTGLTVYNRSVSSTIGKLLIEGVKYNY